MHSSSVSTEDILSLYNTGRYSAKDIVDRLGISERTVFRRLSSAPQDSEYRDTDARHVVVLMDASYWGRNFGVVIIKDNSKHSKKYTLHALGFDCSFALAKTIKP